MVTLMSRKLRHIRRLERHLKKHPNDRVAKKILEALKNNQYEWHGRRLVLKIASS